MTLYFRCWTQFCFWCNYVDEVDNNWLLFSPLSFSLFFHSLFNVFFLSKFTNKILCDTRTLSGSIVIQFNWKSIKIFVSQPIFFDYTRIKSHASVFMFHCSNNWLKNKNKLRVNQQYHLARHINNWFSIFFVMLTLSWISTGSVKSKIFSNKQKTA